VSLSVQSELSLLNADLAKYQELTKKTPEEILLKQGVKLTFALNRQLRTIMPGKGSVRSERLEALKAGRGVYVRPSVRAEVLSKYGAYQDVATRETRFGKRGRKSVLRKGGRRLNLQALMVQRELNLRESGRGFVGFAARFRALGQMRGGIRQKWLDRYSRLLSEAGLTMTAENGVLDLSWTNGPSALHAASGLLKPRAQAAIITAIQDVRSDIWEYLGPKLKENAEGAFTKH